ncbi:MAG: DUF6528 family protein, partial [Draconibacterium sp.]
GKDMMNFTEESNAYIPYLKSTTDGWVGLCNWASKTIDVYDVGVTDWNSASARLMSWKPETWRSYSSLEVSAWNAGYPRDVKVRNSPWGRIWVAVGGNLATITLRNTGHKQWALNLGSGITPHGVELLPNGNIVVVGKDANWVRVYTSSQGTNNYAQFNITSPTSVLWDVKCNVLRVTGQLGSTHVLAALNVGGTASAPTLTQNTGHTSTLPSSGGLSVSSFYGDNDKLFVSTNTGVYTYNKTTKTYTAIPGSAFRAGVNSVFNQPSGEIVETRPNTSGSPYVDFYYSNGSFKWWQNISGTLMYRACLWRNEYEEQEFTIALLPDAQMYTNSAGGGLPGMFTAQTNWIKNNVENENIAYVAMVGDISEYGDAPEEVNNWTNANTAMSVLESISPQIPYGVAVGDHDQILTKVPYAGKGNPLNPSAKFNEYFGVSRFSGRSYYGGAYVGVTCPSGKNDSHYDFFSAFGTDFIVIYIEFSYSADTTNMYTWASNLLSTYPNHKGIVVTHYAMTATGAYSAQGYNIYHHLKRNPNFFLMLTGHITAEYHRQDVNDNSRVTTILANYQGNAYGGDGYMQLLTISLTNNSMSVKTYSPYRNTYQTDENSQFTISPLF